MNGTFKIQIFDIEYSSTRIFSDIRIVPAGFKYYFRTAL